MLQLIVNSDAQRIPLRDNSISAVCTSPPYFGLRQYKGVKPSLWADGSVVCLGMESSPADYISHLVGIFREVRRVLSPQGVCWVVIGDSFWGGGGGNYNTKGKSVKGREVHLTNVKNRYNPPGLKPLDLVGIPHRLALALQADGWWWRSDIIWAKRNPLPESVQGWRWQKHRMKVSSGNRGKEPSRIGAYPDRPQQDHDGKDFAPSVEWQDCPGCFKCEKNGGLVLKKGSWRPTASHEHVLMLTKSPDYFADGEGVKEPGVMRSQNRYTDGRGPKSDGYAPHRQPTGMTGAISRNLRDIIALATEPTSLPHYATFPTTLVKTLLRASVSEKGYCPECSAPWVRVIERATGYVGDGNPYAYPDRPSRGNQMSNERKGKNYYKNQPQQNTVAWLPSCSCGVKETKPGVVLDPFGGIGTSALVANRLGLTGVSMDLSLDYCQIGRQRIIEEAPLLAWEGEKEGFVNEERDIRG